MPQLIGVKSLYKTCLDFVVNNMALLCEKPTSDFDQLPNKLLEDIISGLRNRGGLKRFLGLLAVPHLETLNLKYSSPPYFGSADDLSIELDNSMRCVNLKHLGMEIFSDEFFTSFIPKLSKLQVLDISYSKADDSSLEVIGTCCTHLRALDFRLCKKITDIGVKGLCDGATHNLGSGVDGLGLLKSLVQLRSMGTLITPVGVQLILEHFHSLQVWDMATVQNLTEIHEEFFLNQNLEIPKYSLLSLRIAYNVYIAKTLGFVVSLCPSVTEVDINSYEGLTDSDLLDLLSLKNLRYFKMSGDYPSNGNVTFGGGVTPILKAFGNSLKSLSLSKLSDVNILVITQLCPNLHSLDLIDNLSYFTAKLVKEWVKTERTEPEVLKQLERLRLLGSGIQREHLILLLSSPLLVKITIARCSTFDDDTLQKVAGIQTFSNLEELLISGCHTVTEKGIDVFMNAQNPLKKIVLYSRSQISKSNVERWKEQAKKNNWQLLIEHY